MIKLELTADTAEKLRNQLITLLGENKTTTLWVKEEKPEMVKEFDSITIAEKAVDKPKTRSRATVEKTPDVIPAIAESDRPSENVPAKDPLVVIIHPDTPARTDDLLGTAPTPAANLLDTPVATASSSDITLEKLKHKIASNNNKQAIRDLIKSGYVKADGTPCYGPSDVQEKDYADFWAKLDKL